MFRDQQGAEYPLHEAGLHPTLEGLLISMLTLLDKRRAVADGKNNEQWGGKNPRYKKSTICVKNFGS